MLTYGGVPIPCTESAEAVAWVEATQTLRDVTEFAAVADWPGRWFRGWHPRAMLVTDPPVRVGSLVWRPDATGFAHAHYLVSDECLADIRPKVYSRGGYGALPLAINDGDGGAISTSLYLLPPRPLAQRAGTNGLHLLTLVDARFWWWHRASLIAITPGVTTWAQLFSSIGSALGVSIVTDSISADYLYPTAEMVGRYEYLPLLLDAACAAVGHRLVRKLDGTVVTQQALTAKASQDAQWGKWPRLAGGRYAFAPGAGNDLRAHVPASVTLVNPSTTTDTPLAAAVTLASLSLPQYAGVTGRPLDTKLIQSSAGATGANGAELTTLAQRVARDWYCWQLGNLHVTYAGIANYTPEGYHLIEWTVRAGQCYTRLQRVPCEPSGPLQHYSPTGGSGPVYVGYPVVFTQPPGIVVTTGTYNAPVPTLTETVLGLVPGSISTGFGAVKNLVKIQLPDTTIVNAGKINVTLTNATPGSQQTQMTFTVYNVGTPVTPVTLTPTGVTLSQPVTVTVGTPNTNTPVTTLTTIGTSTGTPATGFGVKTVTQLTTTDAVPVTTSTVTDTFLTTATSTTYNTKIEYAVIDHLATTKYFVISSTAGVVVNTVTGQLTGTATSSLSVVPTGYLTLSTLTVTGTPTMTLPVGTPLYDTVDKKLWVSDGGGLFTEIGPTTGSGTSAGDAGDLQMADGSGGFTEAAVEDDGASVTVTGRKLVVSGLSVLTVDCSGSGPQIGAGGAGAILTLGIGGDGLTFFGGTGALRQSVTGVLSGTPTLAQLTGVVRSLLAALGDTNYNLVKDNTT